MTKSLKESWRDRYQFNEALIFGTLVLSGLLGLPKEFNPIQFTDSMSYFLQAQSIVAGEVPNLTLRTPLYACLIALAESFGNWKYIIFLQVLLSSVAGVLFYRILISQAVVLSRRAALVLTLMIFANPALTVWNSIVMTEATTISLLIFWGYGQILAWSLEQQSSPKFCTASLFVLDICAMLIRPTYFFFPLAWYVSLAIWFRKEKERFWRRIARHVAYVLLLGISYCSFNFYQNGIFQITSVGAFNVLGNILQFGLLSPDSSEKNQFSLEVRKAVEVAQKSGYSETDEEHTKPWGLASALHYPVPQSGTPPEVSRKVTSINREALRGIKAKWIYFARCAGRFLNVLATPNHFQAKDYMLHDYPVLGEALGVLCTALGKLVFLALALNLFFLAAAPRKENGISFVRFLAIVIVLYTEFMNIFGSYNDWSRLMAPASPWLLLLVLMFAISVRDWALRMTDLLRGGVLAEK